MPKRHLLSYLGGLFDGEGCVAINKARAGKWGRVNPTYQVQVHVGMTDQFPLRLFQGVFGGQISSVSRDNCKRYFKWRVASRRCLPILRDLLPYLIVKRPEAEVAIHLLEHTDGSHRRLTEQDLVLREADFILSRSLKERNEERE